MQFADHSIQLISTLKLRWNMKERRKKGERIEQKERKKERQTNDKWQMEE